MPQRFGLVLESCRELAWRMREVGTPTPTDPASHDGCDHAARLRVDAGKHSAHTSVLSPV
ncbi:hypothetical protein AB0H00_13940 [Nocardia sp. NPDC023852]|uniref:hypothetical protein n=1 Tax=Nocardia sp. NPDC023852 TaxID=3154697 RepID=UPI0033C952B7